MSVRSVARATGLAGLCLMIGVSGAEAQSRYALARVVNDTGNPILNGVAPDDILVEQGGERRTVIAVEPAAYPVAVLVDTSGFVRDDFFRLREAVSHFIESLKGREVVVYTFGDRAMRLAPHTRETRELARAVESLFVVEGSEVRMIDAFLDAAKDIGRLRPPVSTIVIVSGGGRDRSGRNPQDVIAAMSASHVIVRFVDRHRPPALTARSGRDQAVPTAVGDEDLLRELARRTQGELIQIAGASGYGPALNQVLDEMSSEWLVTYEGRPTDPPGVRLGIRTPGATIRGIGLGAAEK